MKILLSLAIPIGLALAQNTPGLLGPPSGPGTGTAQAQIVTFQQGWTLAANQLPVCWLPIAANTAAGPTLQVISNGVTLTAKPITKFGTTALVANDLTATAVACAIYDGTQFQLQVPQTVTGGGGSSPINPTANTGHWLPLGDFQPVSGINWASTSLVQINEVRLEQPTNLNNVVIYVITGAASTHGAVMLYSATGSLLYTSSVATTTSSATAYSMTIIGGLLAAGTYLVGFSNDSTTPTYLPYQRNIATGVPAVWAVTGHVRSGYCTNTASWSAGAITPPATCGTIVSNPAQAPNFLFYQ